MYVLRAKPKQIMYFVILACMHASLSLYWWAFYSLAVRGWMLQGVWRIGMEMRNAAAAGDGPGNLHITRPSNQLLEARGQVATGDVCSCTELWASTKFGYASQVDVNIICKFMSEVICYWSGFAWRAFKGRMQVMNTNHKTSQQLRRLMRPLGGWEMRRGNLCVEICSWPDFSFRGQLKS